MKYAGIALAVIGIVALIYGVSMPGDGVREVDVCIRTGEIADPGSTCPTVPEERYVENDMKQPLMVGGGVLILVGWGMLAASEPQMELDPDDVTGHERE